MPALHVPVHMCMARFRKYVRCSCSCCMVLSCCSQKLVMLLDLLLGCSGIGGLAATVHRVVSKAARCLGSSPGAALWTTRWDALSTRLPSLQTTGVSPADRLDVPVLDRVCSCVPHVTVMTGAQG